MRQRILIVEEDATFRETMRSALSKLGCAVRVAESAAKAFELALKDKPDLVILSADVSDNHDLAVCTRFKEHPQLRAIQLLLVYSAANEAAVEAHRWDQATAANDYVRKPIAIHALLLRIEALIPLGVHKSSLRVTSKPSLPRFRAATMPPDPSVPPKRNSDRRALSKNSDSASPRRRRDDRIRVDDDGVAHPLGSTAAQRMLAQRRELRVMPSPPDLLVLHPVDAVSDGGGGDNTVRRRRCRLSGEVFAPGALCDVVSLIAQARWPGELVVLDGQNSRSIFFEPGHVVSAQSTVLRERLDEVLYRYGTLTRAQVALSAAHAEREAIRFGEAAVALGYLTHDTLFRLMGKQTEEIFFGVLTEEGGMFYLLDSYEERSLSYRHRQPIMQLMTDAVRRMDELKFWSEKIPSEQHIPERIEGRSGPEPGGDVELATLYEMIDGMRSVADISRLMALSVFDVTQSLFLLIQAGHIAIRRPTEIYEAVDVYNKAIVLILRELDAMDAGDGVRAELVAFVSEGLYPSLFRGAGPADDGTLDARRITSNLMRLSAPDHALTMVEDALYDYASYAMFLARPHLHRAEEPPKPLIPANANAKKRLSGKIASVLAPLAPSTRAAKKRG